MDRAVLDPRSPLARRLAWQPPQPTALLYLTAALLKGTSSSEMALRSGSETHQTASSPYEKCNVRKSSVAQSWLMIETVLIHNQ